MATTAIAPSNPTATAAAVHGSSIGKYYTSKIGELREVRYYFFVLLLEVYGTE